MNQRINSIVETLKREPGYILVLLGIAIVPLYSWLYLSTPAIFNSPDETATFVFSQRLQSGGLQMPIGEGLTDLVRPRSTNVINQSLVPGSFIGLILVLGLVSLFGEYAVILSPAILAIVGVLAFYGITRRIFNSSIAFTSSLMLFFLPQWMYYTARGFLPNVPFVSLLLVAVFCFIKANEPRQRMWSFGVCSGIFGGLSFAIRPVEFLWVIPLALLALWGLRERITWKTGWGMGVGMILTGLVVGYWHIDTYESLLRTGYDHFSGSENAVSMATGNLFFPFGIDLAGSFGRFWQLAYQLFWWQLIAFAIGLVAYYKSKKSVESKFYSVSYAVIFFYLVLYYGGWGIQDDINPEHIGLGISYVRYWLPIYILSLPYIALGFSALSSRYLLPVFLVISVLMTFAGGKDSLGRVQKNIVQYGQIREAVMSVTPSSAIIISERSDKVFWPSRSVIHFQDSDFTFLRRLSDIDRGHELYLYTIWPYATVSYYEQAYFVPSGYALNLVVSLEGGSSLYKLIPLR